MRFSAVAAALLSAAAAVSAQTQHLVLVGENGGLTFNPTSVNASQGDTVAFQFQAKNHTVTQSTFAAPCTLMDGGVDSGYQPVAANATQFPQWSFTVTNTSAPLWFYCKQTGHCAKGMVFAINPTAAKSFDAFQAAANATGGSTSSAPGSSASGSGSAASPSASGTSTGAISGADRIGGGRAAATVLAAMGLVAGLVL